MKPLHKDYPAEYKVFRDDAGKPTGKVQYYASIFGNVDLVGDRVMPGAFEDSLKAWRASGDPIPVIFSHNWGDPFAIIGYANPDECIEDQKGLLITAQLDIETNPTALQVFKLMERRIMKEASFSYDIPPGGEKKAKDDANNLYKLNILETGPTLKGANPLTDTVSAKSRDIKSILIGSVEERQAALGYAAAEKFDSAEPGDGGRWTYIEGTYDDRIIVGVTGIGQEPQYFSVPYSFNADGDVTLGAETEVRLETTVETETNHDTAPTPKADEADGAKADTDVPKVEGTILEIKVTPVIGDPIELKSLIEAGVEAKAGRRNSNSDQASIQAAHDMTVKAGAVCVLPEDVAVKDQVAVDLDAALDEGGVKAAEVDYLKLAADFAELGDIESELEMLQKAREQKLAKTAKADEADGEKSPPWHIEERDGKFDVVVNETDEVVGTHDTRQEAEDHLAALYANAKAAPDEPDPDKEKAAPARPSADEPDPDKEKAARVPPAPSADEPDPDKEKGVVPADEQGIECPDCGGTGKLSTDGAEKECPTCGGSGHVKAEEKSDDGDVVDEKSAPADSDGAEGKVEEPEGAKTEDPAERAARVKADLAELESFLQ